MIGLRKSFSFYRLNITGNDIDFSWSSCLLSSCLPPQHTNTTPFVFPLPPTTKVSPFFFPLWAEKASQGLFSLQAGVKKLSIFFSCKQKRKQNNRNRGDLENAEAKLSILIYWVRRMEGWEDSGAFWLLGSFLLCAWSLPSAIPWHSWRARGSKQWAISLLLLKKKKPKQYFSLRGSQSWSALGTCLFHWIRNGAEFLLHKCTNPNELLDQINIPLPPMVFN